VYKRDAELSKNLPRCCFDLSFPSRSQNNREFITSKSRNQVLVADGTSEPLGKVAKQRITGIVAEGIIDHLEIVDVEHEESKALLLPFSDGQAFKMALEHKAVRQTGEWIMIGHPQGAFF
jgi:hypothetical protein